MLKSGRRVKYYPFQLKRERSKAGTFKTENSTGTFKSGHIQKQEGPEIQTRLGWSRKVRNAECGKNGSTIEFNV